MEFVELLGDSDYKSQTLNFLRFKSFTLLEIALHRNAYFDPNIQITLMVGVEGLLRFAVHTGPLCFSVNLFTRNL